MKVQLVKMTSAAFHHWKLAVAKESWVDSSVIDGNSLSRISSSGGLLTPSYQLSSRNNSNTGNGFFEGVSSYHDPFGADTTTLKDNMPISAVLANAISVVKRVKETSAADDAEEGGVAALGGGVGRNDGAAASASASASAPTDAQSQLFMSPSASVNAANLAAMSLLNVGGGGGGAATAHGSGGSGGAGGAGGAGERAGFTSIASESEYDRNMRRFSGSSTSSGYVGGAPVDFQNKAQGLEEYNKQQLARVLHSLLREDEQHENANTGGATSAQQQDHSGTSTNPPTGGVAKNGHFASSGLNLGPAEVEMYLQRAFMCKEADLETKRSILRKWVFVFLFVFYLCLIIFVFFSYIVKPFSTVIFLFLLLFVSCHVSRHSDVSFWGVQQ
jgi:hypothetical protein